MPTKINVNGVYREATNYVNVNGVFRKADSWHNINNVWRKSSTNKISINDITGFKLIYTLNRNKQYLQYPELMFNKNLPVNIKLAGNNPTKMDDSPKSIVFQYSRDNPDESGIFVYDGILYAIINDDNLINISGLTFISGMDYDIENFSLMIQGYNLYESYKTPMAGWNTFFNINNIMPDGSMDKKVNLLNSYNILPILDRDDSYDSVASIGIARNIYPGSNMLGSYGTIDQTIEKIYLNDVTKPFVIEIYQ